LKPSVRRHEVAAESPLATPMHRDDFKAEVSNWAIALGVTPTEICLAPMRRKWGSCSTRGRVTFSLDLLLQPDQVRREAIVHELIHLRVPNHGRLFRALLAATLRRTSSPQEG